MKNLCIWVVSRLALSILFIFIYNGGVVDFIDWYIHSLDFIGNESVELTILGCIALVAYILVLYLLWSSKDKNQNNID